MQGVKDIQLGLLSANNLNQAYFIVFILRRKYFLLSARLIRTRLGHFTNLRGILIIER